MAWGLGFSAGFWDSVFFGLTCLAYTFPRGLLVIVEGLLFSTATWISSFEASGFEPLASLAL